MQRKEKGRIYNGGVTLRTGYERRAARESELIGVIDVLDVLGDQY